MDTPIDKSKPIFLSELTLDMRRRENWRLLGDTYDVHRRVLMAFPEASEGGSGRVLFRVESGKGEARILVQSIKEPDWSRLPDSMCDTLRGPKGMSLWRADGSAIFINGRQLRFRLRANPTFRQSQNNVENPRKYAPRLAHLTPVSQAAWLARQGELHGFTLAPVPTGDDWLDPFAETPEDEIRETHYDVRITPIEDLTGRKPATGPGEKEHKLTHYGVDFEGILTVANADALAAAVATGIGPAKGFGFGLLSLARAT